METAQNVQVFKWNAKKIEAAQLCSERLLNEVQIAEKVGISRRQLGRWKEDPAFMARVKQFVDAVDRDLFQRGIASRSYRVRSLNDRWQRLQAIIEARAADMKDVPGGETGLLVREIKAIGSGRNFKEIEEYRVDTGLLRELREHEKQAAQELGQWIEKIAPTSPDGQDEYQGTLTDEQRAAAIIAILTRFGVARSALCLEEVCDGTGTPRVLGGLDGGDASSVVGDANDGKDSGRPGNVDGSALGGPIEDSGPRRPDPGPVADGLSPLDFEADAPPVQPPNG